MPRWLRVVLRLLGTAAGFVWIALTVDLGAAGHALAEISIATFAVATVLVAANVVLGAVRWNMLLRAYGATAIPSMRRLVYLYFIAFFYNYYLPGAVAGDVGRGVVTRDAFVDQGATAALAVVLVERALGLFALFVLLGFGLATTGQALDTGTLWLWTVIGSVGACALVVAIPTARRIARFLPGPLRKIAEKLPTLHDARAFGLAILLSIGTQVLVAVAGWIILATLVPVDFTTSMLVIPLASATAFLPITVGGAGAREAAYVALCRLLGIAEAPALAASLGLWLAHLAVGAAGGVAQLAGHRRTP